MLISAAMRAHPDDLPPAAIDPADFEALVRREMGEASHFSFRIEAMRRGWVRLRLRFAESQLRPGGTIAGPVMFTLADTALYALVMSTAGMVPLAVTTDINLHFLRKPAPRDLVAEARTLKAGRKLVVGEVWIFSAPAERDGDDEDGPVAHVTGTYALPSRA